MEFSLARQHFYQEVRQPDEHIILEKAALHIAQEEYPNLEVDQYLSELDTIAEEIRKRLPLEPYPLKTLQTINRYLYDELKFFGNTTDYYDPRNSLLNDVLDRRTGIPITLSVVYLAIAQRIDFPMVGIGMPGHFLIRPNQEEMEIFVDPFSQGEILFSQDCQERLNQLFGQPVEMQSQFLEPVSNRQILARILTNLKAIYVNRNEMDKALAAIDRILVIFPDAAFELRDRGILYFRMDRWTEARRDLERYLETLPRAEDGDTIRQLLKQIGNG